MSEIINEGVGRPLGSPGGYRSRVWKKFVEKFPELNHDYNRELNRFSDLFVHGLYEVFIKGYMSHPSYGSKRVSLVGRVTEEGIEVSTRPVLHMTTESAANEARKLTKRYKNKYVVFSCLDGDEDLTNKARTRLAKILAERQAQRERNRGENEKAQSMAVKVRECAVTGERMEVENMSQTLVDLLFMESYYRPNKDTVVCMDIVQGWGIVSVDGVQGERESFVSHHLVRYDRHNERFKEERIVDIETIHTLTKMFNNGGITGEAIRQVLSGVKVVLEQIPSDRSGT